MRSSISVLAALATAANAIGFGSWHNALVTQWKQLTDANPDYISMVENMNAVTVIAPNDNAMKQFQSAGYAQSEIMDLLKYMTISSAYTQHDLVNNGPFQKTQYQASGMSGGQVMQFAYGPQSKVMLFSGYNANATVIDGDFKIDNGYIQVVDNMPMLPAGIIETCVAAGLTSAAGAASEANAAWQTQKDATVFVPTNGAFEAVGSVLSNASSDDLDSILAYHLLDRSSPLYTSDIDGTSYNTAGKGSVNVDYIGEDVLFVNQAEVIEANIIVDNGVMHVIDQVLNPSSTAAISSGAAYGHVMFSSASAVATPPFAGDVPPSETTGTQTVYPGPARTPVGDAAPVQYQSAASSTAFVTVSLGVVSALIGAVAFVL